MSLPTLYFAKQPYASHFAVSPISAINTDSIVTSSQCEQDTLISLNQADAKKNNLSTVKDKTADPMVMNLIDLPTAADDLSDCDDDTWVKIGNITLHNADKEVIMNNKWL